jgi:hypothetical protein
METRKRVLRAEHPSRLTSMANLASTYRNKEGWMEAEELEVQSWRPERGYWERSILLCQLA